MKKGVELRTGELVQRIEGRDGAVCGISTSKGRYEVDAVVFAIGVQPNTELFTDPRFKKLKNGAIITTDAMETGVPDVYAAGDCATLYTPSRASWTTSPSARTPTSRAASPPTPYSATRYTSTAPSAQASCASWTSRWARPASPSARRRSAAWTYGTATVQNISHSPYYTCPAPYTLTAKIVYDRKTHVLLGAQIMGEHEAAMRINIFACAVDRKMTTEELGMLDMAYSPSVTYIWDIVHVVANAAK